MIRNMEGIKNIEKLKSLIQVDDILGDKIPSDQETAMRRFCYQTLKGDGVPQQFHGSLPISLNRENLQLLGERYYCATWKPYGPRYMMLITMDGCYLIDRHFSFRRVQMRFPCQHVSGVYGSKATERRFHHLTLLDGEMVIDSSSDYLEKERTYLVNDVMAINGVSIVERPFCERSKMLYKEVIEPRNIERPYQYHIYKLEAFRVIRKKNFLLSAVEKLHQLIPELPHEADGLTFKGYDDPYVPGTHEGLLEWKFPLCYTVDFLFEVVDNHQLLYLFEQGKNRLIEDRVIFPEGPDASAYAGKIIECRWNSDANAWICMRVGLDKGTPNGLKAMKSIKDDVPAKELLSFVNEIIRLPAYADRTRSIR